MKATENMNEKFLAAHVDAPCSGVYRIAKVARFLGRCAGAPVGIVHSICLAMDGTFDRLKEAGDPLEIAEIEDRLAELQKRVYELSGRTLLLAEAASRTAEPARVVNSLVDGERNVLDTIFRHNLKLQKPGMIIQY
jgi:hypothetical protein